MAIWEAYSRAELRFLQVLSTEMILMSYHLTSYVNKINIILNQKKCVKSNKVAVAEILNPLRKYFCFFTLV